MTAIAKTLPIEEEPVQHFRNIINPLTESNSKFRQPLNELIDFFSTNTISFLIGAGCSSCAGLPLMEELTKDVFSKLIFESDEKKLLDDLQAIFCGENSCNIEDYLSELVDYISIVERREERNANHPEILINNKEYSADDLKRYLNYYQSLIENVISSKKLNLDTHRHFINSIHHRIQLGRKDSVEPVDYYTLNYDTIFEDVLALEKIPFTDGFVGGTTGWWEPKTYRDTSSINARVFKIHGSIDWCCFDEETHPRRIREKIIEIGPRKPILIWPVATKYIESQRDPFALIIDHFRETIRPKSLKQVVLIIIGYSFGDNHINDELYRALIESNNQLTLVIFTNQNIPVGILDEWFKNPSINKQVRIYANRGFFHESTVIESDFDLHWWKFEILTQLLGGFI